MTIAATSTAMQDIVDNAEERELWIVAKEHERPPFFHEGKGGDTRLARAIRVCFDGKITPNSDGSYTVEGSAGRTYRVTNSCTCPHSQGSKSKYCYHFVAVCLYIEWQKRLRPAQPVALGTLRPGTLPLPPVTVEERLALGTMRDSTALSTHHTPQEDRMDDHEYIPEPDTDDAPVATLDAPVATMPTVVKIPREFTVNIKGKTHVLYTGLVVAARHDGLVSLSADWTYNDAELSLAHAVATFADGRRYEESGDASPSNVSKGISVHFRRVALTRAKARCLRDALGISECSVEELGDASVPHDVPDMTLPLSEQDLRRRIWQRIKVLAPDVNTKEAVEAVVSMRTGLTLIPDNYRAIIELLERK